MELRVAGGHLRASIEIKEMFPEKLRAVLEQRGAIHLRLQIELWQHRPVWDKQPQPAVLAVFRIVLDPATRLVQVADQYGEVSRQPAWQEPLVLRLDLGRGDVLSDTGRYYIRTQATLGTIAEREATQAADAVFGPDEGSVTLGSMGRAALSRGAAGERLPAERVRRGANARHHGSGAESRCETLETDTDFAGPRPDLDHRAAHRNRLVLTLDPELDPKIARAVEDLVGGEVPADFALARLVRLAVGRLIRDRAVAPVPLDGGAIELLAVVWPTLDVGGDDDSGGRERNGG